MIGITAQVSLYPLPQSPPAPEVGEALQVFRECAVEVEPDAVSTLPVGDDDGAPIVRPNTARRCAASQQASRMEACHHCSAWGIQWIRYEGLTAPLLRAERIVGERRWGNYSV
jgi:hypothetical protein